MLTASSLLFMELSFRNDKILHPSHFQLRYSLSVLAISANLKKDQPVRKKNVNSEI